MAKKRSSTTNPKEPRLLSRWYVFCVVFCAVFLIGVAVWHRKPTAYTARSVVELAPTKSGDKAAGQGAAAILTSSETLERIVADAKLETTGDQEHAVSWLQRHTGVTTTAAASGRQQLTITFTGRHKAKTLEVTQSLVRWVTDHSSDVPHSDAKSADVAKVNHAFAVSQVRKFESELSAVNRQIADLNALDVPSEPKPVDPPLGLPGLEPPAGGDNADGELSASKSERLAVLKSSRDQLLETFTDNHPKVRDLTWQIEKLEEQMANDRESHARQLRDAQREQQQSRRQTLTARRDLLEGQLTEAKAKLSEAETELSNVSRENLDEPAFAGAKVVQAPQIAASIGGGTSLFRVFVVGLAAFAIAFLFTRMTRSVVKAAVLTGTEHLRQLGIPVVAALATPNGPAIHAPAAQTPAPVRWAVRLCEVALLILVATLIVLALWDAAFGALFARNPVEAVGSLAIYLP